MAEKYVVAGDDLRSSIRRTSSLNSKEKIPHYLRASTGTCHDFCKYGRKNASETKARDSIPTKWRRKPFEGESSLDIVVLPVGKKMTSTQGQPKFSSISKPLEADEVSKKSPKREIPDEKKKKLLAKPRILRFSGSQAANVSRTSKQKDAPAARNPEDSRKQGFLKAIEKELPEKCDKILRSKPMKVKPLRSTGSLNSSRRNIDSRAAKEVMASSKVSSSSNSVHRFANSIAKKNGNPKTIPFKTHNKIKISEPDQVQSGEVQEKTLYVIKIENEEKPQEPDQNGTDDNMEAVSSSPKLSSSPTSPSLLPHEEDHEDSEYTESDAEDDSFSEGDEFDDMEAEKPSSGSSKGRSQNHGMLQSHEMNPQSIKLSFSRGKILDIHSEKNSPRRLKFRRGRLLGESRKAMDSHRQNFKSGKEVEHDTNGTETAPETVVLRHQDVQHGKKDAQGLFNNVIEETASKLVETRKSKVKALVGAFETVISLQDGKPSPEIVSL